MKKNVWFGLIKVKPINNNKDLGDAEGAYVNVAYVSIDSENFKLSVMESFNLYDFRVLEIEDIEDLSNLTIDNPDNSEKIELLEVIRNGEEFAWGTFHTW